MRWLSENRDSIKSSLEESGESSAPKHVTKKGGELWKEMSEEEQMKYNPSEEDKLEYEKALEKYYEENPEAPRGKSKGDKKSRKSKFSSDEPLELPHPGEGWTEMIEGKYLPKYVKDENGKKMSYKDLDSAVSAASEIDECGGVTAEAGSSGWRFTLRMGGEFDAKDSKKNESSWAKVGGAPAPVTKKTKKSEKSEKKEGGFYLSGAGIPDGLDEDEGF